MAAPDMTIRIRPIQARDDAAMAAIIRAVMPEFGAVGCGFAINDPEVDWMSRAYAQPRCAYFVVEELDSKAGGSKAGDLKAGDTKAGDSTAGGVVLGGGGVAPLENGDGDTCELRKMYFLPQVRGRGAGAAMMTQCLDAARGFNFRQCYLETLSGMDAAMKLYERSGFRRVDAPLGDTGHGGCNTFYLLDL